MNLTFVVSTGRCGSTLLSQILHEHPGILSVNELFGIVSVKDRLAGTLDGPAFWRRIADPVPVMDGLVRHGLALPEFLYPYATGRFSPDTGVPYISHMTLPALTDDPDDLYDWLRSAVSRWPARPAPDHYRHLFALLSERFGGQAVVERAGGSITAVAHLRRAFPEARFVYLGRDGMDCALSMSKHAGCRLPVLARLTGALTGAGRAAADRPGRPDEEARPLGVGQIMRARIPLPAFGDFWSEQTLVGAAELPRVPRSLWTTLRYEDLLRDPVPNLRRLTRFIGTTAPPEWLARASDMVDPTRIGASAHLDPDVAASLREACAPGRAADEALHARLAPDTRDRRDHESRL